MERRSLLRRVVIGSVLILVGCAAWVWFAGHASHDQARPKLSELPGYEPSAVYTASYNSSMADLRNAIVRKPIWTESEASVVRELALTPYTFSGRDWDAASLTEIEAFRLHNAAMVAIGERLQLGYPVEAPAREMLVRTLLEQLDHPVWYSRVLAVSVIVQSGLTEDPDIRRRIEAMVHDPDPDVSANAVRQLRHRERIKEYRARMAEWEGRK